MSLNAFGSFASRFVPNNAADRPPAGPSSCEELYLTGASWFLGADRRLVEFV